MSLSADKNGKMCHICTEESGQTSQLLAEANQTQARADPFSLQAPGNFKMLR